MVCAASGGLVSMIDPLARQSNVTCFCCVSESPSASEARPELFTTAADQTDPEHHIVPVPLPSRLSGLLAQSATKSFGCYSIISLDSLAIPR
jgi:hypothetical protein